MSAAAASLSLAARPPGPGDHDPQSVSLTRQVGRSLAAEWVKARSVPSTWSALCSATFILVAIGAAICRMVPAGDVPADGFEPMLQVMAGVPMAQVAVGVLGALAITTEYTSRSITSTLAAVPRRGLLLGGKAGVVALLYAPFALLGCALAPVVSLPLLRDKGLRLALTDALVVRGVLGTAAVLVLTALLGLAAGALLRSTAASVIVLTVVLFLLPVLLTLLPAADRTLGPWLPSRAGGAVLLLHPADGYLSPAAGLALTTACTAGALAAAVVVLRRRDA